jgi:hypothetical protein
MNSAALERLLAEAKASVAELWDVQRPLLISPGHLHELARARTNLIETCQQLHTRNIALLVAAARREPPRDVL